jgi:hypothetical protein
MSTISTQVMTSQESGHHVAYDRAVTDVEQPIFHAVPLDQLSTLGS